MSDLKRRLAPLNGMMLFMKMLKTLGINFILFSFMCKISSSTRRTNSFRNCGQLDSCTISISRIDEPTNCKMERNLSVTKSRHYYKLTRLGGKPNTEFPLPSIPFLNQTMQTVKFRTAMDPIDSKWLVQYKTMSQAASEMGKKLLDIFADSTFNKAEDYVELFKVHEMLIKSLHVPDIFSNPAMDPSFTDIIYNNRYLSDEIFIQQRLAGICPFLIKLVTRKRNVGLHFSKLKSLLNPTFGFDAALQDALKDKYITMERAVLRGRLYAVYHQEHNDIKTNPDYFGKHNILINMTSPITLFARTKTGDLKIVAIQVDYKSTAAVYTPKSDIFDWTLAKSLANSADLNICQAIWHLSHVHLSSGVYCTIFKSHFSNLHPLYQIMRHHCEGTAPHIALTYEALTAPHQLGHRIFSISNAGFIKLTVNGYDQFHYGTLAFDSILKSNGLDSYKIKYHPFRDDGLVIWRAFKGFANNFVNMFYKNDDDVASDSELQSFAKQISLEGGAGDSYGGKGNIAGFPDVFKTRAEVRLFVTRFLWQIAMHSAVNYPLEPWGSFIPLAPSKLYDNRQTSDSFKEAFPSALPDKFTSISAVTFAEILGNLRINRIFDYYTKIDDRKLRTLVKRYHSRFFGCIQDLLRKRNEKRKVNGQVGFQYFEPIWMTNSVHV